MTGNCVWLQRGETGFASVEAFISQRIFGKPKDIPGTTIMVVLRRDALHGAVIYQNYIRDYGTLEISAAAVDANWLSRSVLFRMFRYPFIQLGCQAVIMRCDPADKRLNRIFKSYGFSRHDIPRLRGRDKSEAIYVLRDEDWRNNGFHKELGNE